MRMLINIFILFSLFSCNHTISDGDLIEKLKTEKGTTQVILNSIEAGNRKKLIFVKYLLKDSYDYNISTNIKCYNQSIYGSKMKALEKIFGKSPNVKITQSPDSLVIKFYTEIAKDVTAL